MSSGKLYRTTGVSFTGQRKILLMNSHSREGVYVTPAMGIFKVAEFARKRGIDCDILDYDIDDDSEFIKNAERGEYAVIAMSVTHYQMEADLERLWMFRKCAEKSGNPVIIAGGGQEAAMNYEQWLDAALDIVFLGFAEVTFYEFCRRVLDADRKLFDLSALADGLKGMTYRDQGGKLVFHYADTMDHDKFRGMFYDSVLEMDVPYQKYWDYLRQSFKGRDVGGAGFIFEHVRLYGTSHCPRRCGFCSSQTFLPFSQEATPKISMLDADQLVHLVVHHYQKYGAKLVIFSDDDFLVGPGVGARRALSFCKGIIAAKKSGDLPSDFHFHFQARIADVLTRHQINMELLQALVDAGCMGCSLGVETFSEKLIKSPSINKIGVTVTDCRDVLNAMLDIGMVPQINIILGPPESTVEDLIDTIKVVAEFIEKGADIALVTRVEVYPGSPLSMNRKYPYHSRTWTNPHNGQSIEIADYFKSWDQDIERVCTNFNKARDAELDLIKKRYGWENQIIHKRIVAFGSIIAILKILERPDLLRDISGVMERIIQQSGDKAAE